MSALGHFIEEEGIATVAIALIRPQAERTRPPRALWVPFELGRPFGPPSDPRFQRRVLMSALRLLESGQGPVLLTDFPDDDPRETDDPRWTPPIDREPDLEREIAALAPAYARSCKQRGRTTVGLSGLAPDAAARFVGAWLAGSPPPSPVGELSPILCLRFAADDLKAYAQESALAGDAKPSSRQLAHWLWNETQIGTALHRIRDGLVTASDERAKLVGQMFLVPALHVRAGQPSTEVPSRA